MSVFISILGLGLLILIHEAGHFFVARAVGMNPRKFYLGFPPAIAKTKRNGIEYGIGAIPLGGYVKIPGMHRPAAGDLDLYFGRALHEEPSLRRPIDELRRLLDEAEYGDARAALARVRESLAPLELSPAAFRSAERGVSEIDDALAPDAYWRAKTWKRVAVIFAGPAANLVLAVALFSAIVMAGDAYYRVGVGLGNSGGQATQVVERVEADSPAAAAGLKPRDRIVAVDGRRVDGDALIEAIRASRGRPITFTVSRAGRQLELKPIRAENYESPGAVASVWEALRFTGRVTKDIGESIGRLVTGEGRDQISSPVGIVQGSSEAVEEGAETYLIVLGLISLSLALLNLLPLLPLDGGHIAFSLLEGVRGRAVAREIYERVSVVGIAVVLLLFFIGLTNDIGRLGE